MPHSIRVRFEITVPASTPADSQIYVTGSAPALKNWNPAGLPAHRVSERLFEATAELEPGSVVEFKVTRGSWDKAEVDRAGGQRQNRRRRLRRSGPVRVTVVEWGDVRRRVRGPVGLNHQHAVPSKSLGGDRKVMVHLPPGYQEETRSYPLLVMHDGQNLFDDATAYGGVKWAVDEAVDRLVQAGKIEPVIVVGVWNSPDRMREYHPDRPLARQYEIFLVEELIPWLRPQYRLLNERTGVAGSSMGGIISLDLFERRRDTFMRAGVVSPSLFAGRGVAARLKANPIPPDGRRLWMDMGTLEARGDTLAAFESLRKQFVSDSWGPELAHVVVPGGRHHEHDWARRMPKILMHLYPPAIR